MHAFGLIGYPLSHSFSKKYYTEKMEKEGITGISYELYSLPQADALAQLIQDLPQLSGVNVTIPHKIAVMDLLDALDDEAEDIGAVNCIQIWRNPGQKPYLKGFNTDIYGFRESLRPLLKPHHQQALVLGNGGASKAVCYALSQLDIPFKVVARRPEPGQIRFEELDEHLLQHYKVLINCTPLGTYPDVEGYPPLPYEALGEEHLLYDLVYNPTTTQFMQKGLEKGATVKNGWEMLVLQAERNWALWMEVIANAKD